MVQEGGSGDQGDEGAQNFEICTVASECKAGIGTGNNGHPAVNETQKVHFGGFNSGNTYTLGNLPGSCSSSSTDPITYTGSAASVRTNMQEALEAKCGAGNFSLASGPANPVVTFQGSFAGVNVPTMTCTTNTGSGTCEITDNTDGSPAQIATASGNGSLDHPQSVAVDQDTGNVYVSDRGNRRIDEYEADGTFIRSFGWDVAESGPGDTGTEYEICEEAEGDICKAGASGSGTGQISSNNTAGILGIAVSPADGEAASGTVFVADSGNRRVNTYALDGTSPADFGSSSQFGSTQPRKVAVDSRGIVYASNSNNHGEILRYDTENADGEGVGFLAPIEGLDPGGQRGTENQLQPGRRRHSQRGRHLHPHLPQRRNDWRNHLRRGHTYRKRTRSAKRSNRNAAAATRWTPRTSAVPPKSSSKAASRRRTSRR